MDAWRHGLARSIAADNAQLSVRDLNFAVQQTLDRIVFLRICEDRGIERYGRLRDLGTNANIYEKLLQIFRESDAKYNSGLFHFRDERGQRSDPDTITPGIAIEDAPLKKVIAALYYPESPYEFSVLPVEILGQVYERFLGKVISLTEGHRARVEEKPEVRKAGGVYYTPIFIVDYMMRVTLGRLLRNRTPSEALDIRLLDPACGSGSFLIGAYQYLLDWHQAWYEKHDPARYARGRNPAVYRGRAGTWKLTTRAKREILLRNIFGVDIDPQAVEVTKLSLLLKLLEGETNENLALFPDRVLPDLSSNIKCGNSLIGPDYYTVQPEPVTDEERWRVRPFDWGAAFPSILGRGATGGFDLVIGNPPYVKEYTYSQPFRDLRGTGLERYYEGKMDIWQIFAALSIDLLRNGGFHSFIATNNWVTSEGASILRDKVMAETKMESFFDFGSRMVFRDASQQTMIYVLRKTQRGHRGAVSYARVTSAHMPEDDLSRVLAGDSDPRVHQFKAQVERTAGVLSFVDDRTSRILDKIARAGRRRLGEDEIGTGIDVHQDFVTKKHIEVLRNPDISVGDGIFVVSDVERRHMQLSRKEREILKPYYTSAELDRYAGTAENRWWVIYTDPTAVAQMDEFPNLRAHFDRYERIITSDNKPYGLHRAREERLFLGEKLISLRKTKWPRVTYVDFPCYVSQTFFVIKARDLDLKYLCGVLNSSVSWFWLRHRGKRQGDALQVDKGPLMEFPIKVPSPANRVERYLANHVVTLTNRCITLTQRLRGAGRSESTMIRSELEATEREIDRAVYDLYKLNESDVALVDAESLPARTDDRSEKQGREAA
jgi:adenine-specific DNA-methyltransferase